MILHADMDAFYAAIEVRENPQLRGKPVIVGADPRGRGVVSTCSYEARTFGVRSAMPIRQAFALCPDGVYLPVRMGLYASVSRQVMEIFETFSPSVEPLSIDEAFLDMKGCESLHGGLEEAGRRIKKKILEETSLICSVGIAPTKFMAKLATELGKPDGLKMVLQDQVQVVLDPLPVTRVFGVGPRTAQVLASIGITTVGQIARVPTRTLESALGPASTRHIQHLARGLDDRQVEPYRQQRQLSSERTFDVDLEDRTRMRRQLLDLSGQVGSGLRRNGWKTRSIRLKVRTEDFTTHLKSRTLARPTDSDRVLYQVACALFDELHPDRPVRLLGVGGAELVTGDEPVQGTLFGPPPEDVKTGLVDRTKDRIREKFGSEALVPATLVERPGRKGPGNQGGEG